MFKQFNLKKYLIKKKTKTFVVGEIGLNHEGKLKKCYRLIDVAKKSGFDAVKLQISDPDESYFPKSNSYNYFKKYSLSKKNLYKVVQYAKKKQILIFSTFGDIESLKFQDYFQFPIIKISSGLITNPPLIKKIAKKNKPIILSTGMAFEREIYNAVKLIKKFNSKDLIILACTSIYPCADDMVNLNKINSLKNKFKTYVGYSDHTKDNFACISSVILGAKVIEKHITLEKKNSGDHKISADKFEMPKLIKDIRRAEIMLGINNIKPNDAELKFRKIYLRKIVTKKRILKGETFNLQNIGLIRSPNFTKSAISIEKFEKLLGKKNLKLINAYKLVTKENFN